MLFTATAVSAFARGRGRTRTCGVDPAPATHECHDPHPALGGATEDQAGHTTTWTISLERIARDYAHWRDCARRAKRALRLAFLNKECRLLPFSLSLSAQGCRSICAAQYGEQSGTVLEGSEPQRRFAVGARARCARAGILLFIPSAKVPRDWLCGVLSLLRCSLFCERDGPQTPTGAVPQFGQARGALTRVTRGRAQMRACVASRVRAQRGGAMALQGPGCLSGERGHGQGAATAGYTLRSRLCAGDSQSEIPLPPLSLSRLPTVFRARPAGVGTSHRGLGPGGAT